MDQKVKLQFSTDLEDVPKFSSATLEDAVDNVCKLQDIIGQLKRALHSVDITEPQDRENLKLILTDFDRCRVLLSKIDMRLGDTASIVSGLNSIFEGKQPAQEEEKDDSISAG
jgi:hypothetical protein